MSDRTDPNGWWAANAKIKRTGTGRTYTGVLVNYENPDPLTLNLTDVAHHLSMCCRFAGGVKRFYSVAEHSFLVSQFCEPKDAFAGLMHDASEAYCHDIVSGFKKMPQMSGYREIEEKFMRALAIRFGFEYPLPISVHESDQLVAKTEASQLLLRRPDWADQALDIEIQAWSPEQAERMFLQRFHELRLAQQTQEAYL